MNFNITKGDSQEERRLISI